jgi:flagellar basal-body rod modification protein FlgD
MTTTPTAVLGTTTTAAAGQQVSSGLASLTSNFQSFLSLLTTQLQNQDPTNPMDTNQFTQQLVQMTGVQQQLLTNNLLNTLVAQGQGGLSNSVSYIGDTVEATDANQTLSGGQATWSYSLPAQASSAAITVTDSLGNTVYSATAPSLAAGLHSFSWNGKDTSGAQLPDGGTYTMAISAKDAAGNALSSQVLTVGKVTAATLNNGAAYLTIGANSVPVSSVVSVQPAGSSSAATQ